MTQTTLSIAQARHMALSAQLLDGNTTLPAGKEGIARTIEALGYVQIDTIAVVQRAHHHTLWNRRPDYEPAMLHELQSQDRRVFEYWAHAASYLPMSDYRFYLPRMRDYSDPSSSWHKHRMERGGHLMEPVLERIRAEGPLGSKDFKPPPGTQRGAWWDWQPAKVALELLFWRGDLMITERHNFQRRYDLTERVLPADVDTSMPDDAELGQFLVRRALQAYGVAGESEIRDHIRSAGKEIIKPAIEALVEAGEVLAVSVEGDSDGEYFALTEALESLPHAPLSPAHVYLLSPFDNLIIQRERLKWLFDFGYSLECYLPAAKRQHGYFVLPILWGDRLVGRLDPKADRKAKTFIARNLRFEPDFDEFDALLPPLARRLAEFARFNGCCRLAFEQVEPTHLRPTLERLGRDADMDVISFGT